LATSQNGVANSGVACNPLREAIFVPLNGTYNLVQWYTTARTLQKFIAQGIKISLLIANISFNIGVENLVIHQVIVKLTIFSIINTCVGIYIFFSPLELNRIMVEWLNKVHLAHSDHSKLWQPQEVLVDIFNFIYAILNIYFASNVFHSK